MKPVDQTKFGKDHGNCFSACIASVLEVPLGDVPEIDVTLKHRWMGPFQAYFKSLGLAYVEFNISDAKVVVPLPEGVCCIVSGPSPRGDFDHSVVGVTETRDIIMAYDPHPSGDGVEECHEVGFFVSVGVFEPTQTIVPPSLTLEERQKRQLAIAQKGPR